MSHCVIKHTHNFIRSFVHSYKTEEQILFVLDRCANYRKRGNDIKGHPASMDEDEHLGM